MIQSQTNIQSTATRVLSLQQKRAKELHKNGAGLHCFCEMSLRGEIDLLRLERSIDAVIGKHDIFREASWLAAGLPNVLWHGGGWFGNESNTAGTPTVISGRTMYLFDVRVIRYAENIHAVAIRATGVVADTISLLNVLGAIAAVYTETDLANANQPTVSYSRYTDWQNTLQNEPEEEGVHFWNTSDLTDQLKLPFEQTAGSSSLYGPLTSTRIFSDDCHRAVKACARALAVSDSSVVMTALAVLMHRYTNCDKLLVANVFHGREITDLQSVIGPIARALPVSLNIGSEDKVKDVVVRTDRAIAEVNLWQDSYPREWQESEKYFSIGFEYVDVRERLALKDLQNFAITHVANQPDKFKLNLLCVDYRDRLQIDICYDPVYFVAESITILGAHLESLLTTLPRDIQKSVGQLSFFTDHDDKIIVPKTIGPSGSKTILDYFEANVLKNPQAEAIFLKNRSLSYAEVNTAAEKVAYFLANECPSGKPQIAALLVNYSEWMIIGILGAMKAGVALLPLDTQQPVERLKFMLLDSTASALLTESDFLFRLSDFFSGDILAMDIQLDGMEVKPVARRNAATVGDLAYVIYTSGSTGMPKGVMIGHASLINYLIWANEYYFDGAKIVFGVFTPLVFDLTLTSVFVPLLRGDALFFDAGKDNQESLFNMFRADNPVDTVKCTPSHIRALEQLKVMQTNVKRVIVGGEALQKTHIAYLKSINPSMRIFNEYGPTEATIGCVVQEATQGSLAIGSPIDNADIQIINKDAMRVPVGVPGEFYIGGAVLAWGYMNQPELTAEKFLPGFGDGAERYYRTGDVGRRLSDGTIEYLGRDDEQVKIRGFRIELAEIEHAMERCGLAKRVAVIVEGDHDNKRIVAYLLSDDRHLDENDTRKSLAPHLPEYMIPTEFVLVDQFPLTINGKLDKRLLPETRKKHNVAYVGPANELERSVVAVFEKVLGKTHIGVKSNFFVLGGDSIKAIQVAARLHNLGYKAEVRNILQYPLVEDLARSLRKVHQATQDSVSGVVKLTPIQHYFFAQKSPVSHHFNQAMLLQADALSEKMTGAILTKLINHHDALRMVFRQEGDAIIQINTDADEKKPDLAVFDFTQLSVQEAMLHLAAECQRVQDSLDLTNGPLVKSILFHLPGEDKLFIAIHHLVVDAVSWRILLEDLSTLMRQYRENKMLVLPPKTASYHDWSEKINAWPATKQFDQQQDYWARQELQLENILILTPDHAQVNNYIKDATSETFALTRTETEQLVSAQRAFHTDFNDVLLTAFALTLDSIYHNNNILLCLEGHGREELFSQTDVTRSVGWFTTLFPVILHVNREDSQAMNLMRVKEQLREIPYKGIGYGVRRYIAKTDTSRQVRPQIRFNYLGHFDSSEDTINDMRVVGGPTGSGIHDLWERDCEWDITGIVLQGELRMSLTYNQKAFDRAIIQKILKAFRRNLNDIVGFCLSQMKPVLTPADVTGKHLNLDQLLALQQRHDVADVYELSPLQEGLLYHAMREHSDTYFEQISYRINADLDVDLFKTSLSYLVQRHPTLRTYFVLREYEVPVQVVMKERDTGFSYIDWRMVSEDEKQENVSQFRSEDRQRGFDLANDPLMRVSLLHLHQNEYELVWSHHHIVMDGWCTTILIGEFWEIYREFQAGREPRLKAARPYSEYLRWLQRVDEAASLDFWASYLTNYEETAQFPKNLNRAGNSSQQTEFIALGKERTTKLRNVCESTQVTLNTSVQCLWGLLLSRYAGKKDVVFGSVVSGRPADLAGVEDMIGLFINTVPVRIKYDQGTRLAELLKAHQQQALQAQAHHHCQLAQIQANSGLGAELLDHIMIFENYPVETKVSETQASNAQVIRDTYDIHIYEKTNYDLTAIVIPASELSVKLVFNDVVYHPDLIRQLGRHFLFIVDQVIANHDATVEELALIAEEEELQLLTANIGNEETIREHSILDLFARVVQSAPDAVAVVCQDQSFTYAQIAFMASCVANRLAGGSQVSNTIVGIFAGRSELMIAGMLGILKAGAAYLPLDPDHPQIRIDYMLSDSAVSVVLADRDMKLSHDIEIIDIRETCARRQPLKADHPLRGDDAVYVMYTSGSTGLPKGVLIEHRSVVNLIRSVQKSITIQPGDRLLAVTTFTFDISVLELLWPLTAGAAVVILKKERMADFSALKELVVATRPAVMQGTPSLWEGVLHSGWKGDGTVKILCGGEPLSLALAQELVKNASGLWNMYGPTETTIWSAIKHFGKVPDQVTVGGAIDNTQVYILDETEKAVPAGIEGEVYIAGDGLARGYLNRPELTHEKFVSVPSASSRAYKTGDRARWAFENKGAMEFLGRRDDQVKIRGHRIELTEIEQTMERVLGINRVVVNCVVSAWEKMLVAYFVSDVELDSSAIRATLLQHLPPHMIPADFISLDAFPQNTNGKLDKKALPVPGVHRATKVLVAENPVERRIATIWERILKRQPIGVNEDFFALGGHSVTAVRVIGQIHKEFDVTIEVKEFFQQATIAGLAKLIGTSSNEKYEPIRALSKQDHYAVAPAQKQLWVEQQLHLGLPTYHLSGAFKLMGEIDVAALTNAVDALVERHESLRTTFGEIDGELRQVVRNTSGEIPCLEYEDVRGLANSESYVSDSVKSQSRVAFDLKNGKLLRINLLQINDAEYVFALTLHHIICDAWSIKVLMNDLFTLYRAFEQGIPNPLPALNVQFKDYCNWQLQKLSRSVDRDRAYWHSKLAGELPTIEIPADFRRPPVKTYNGSSVSLHIGTKEAQSLYDFCEREGVTLFMGLTTIVNLLLFKYTGSSDIIIGTPVAGRNHSDLENQIGFYINTVPLRTQLEDTFSIRELVHQVRQTTLEAFEHQSYSYHSLVSELNYRRDMSRSPLFDVVVVLQNASASKFDTPAPAGVGMSAYGRGNVSSMVDLRFEFVEGPDGIHFQLDYNTDVYKRKRAEDIQRHFVRVVEQVINHADRPVSEINYLTERECQELLTDPRSSDVPSTSLIEIFERCVSQHGNSIALEYNDTMISYAMLDEQSSMLANRLRNVHGVDYGDLVGIMTERGPFSIISIIATLKIGAAYVPLDPTYPVERLKYMASDAALKLVISEASLMFDITWYTKGLCIVDIELEGARDSSGVYVRVLPDDPAYVIYTSGSTGFPKGVVIEHRGIANTVTSMARQFNIAHRDKILQFASLSFDSSICEIGICWSHGATLVLIDKHKITQPDRFLPYLKEHDVTVVTFPPAYLNKLNKELLSLSLVITAGEAANPVDAKECLSFARYFNAYGPTEASVCATVHEVTAADANDSPVPIGHPIEGTAVYVLDSNKRLVARGVYGEIYLSGAGVARGYLNRPELTDERFVNNPFATGERLYRTGDLGRWLEGGILEWSGRRDDQVKVRGHRVELNEVKLAVETYPSVKAAEVLLSRDAGLERDVVAYYVSPTPVEKNALRQHLQQLLPDYMIPHRFIWMEAFPVTLNGKIDKRSLPIAEISDEQMHVPPSVGIERDLINIWETILQRKDIGITDSFFAMGGDSLKVIKLYEALKLRLPHATFSIADLFSYPTIAGLLSFIGDQYETDAEVIDLD